MQMTRMDIATVYLIMRDRRSSSGARGSSVTVCECVRVAMDPAYARSPVGS